MEVLRAAIEVTVNAVAAVAIYLTPYNLFESRFILNLFRSSNLIVAKSFLPASLTKVFFSFIPGKMCGCGSELNYLAGWLVV